MIGTSRLNRTGKSPASSSTQPNAVVRRICLVTCVPGRVVYARREVLANRHHPNLLLRVAVIVAADIACQPENARANLLADGSHVEGFAGAELLHHFVVAHVCLHRLAYITHLAPGKAPIACAGLRVPSTPWRQWPGR